MIAYNDEDYIAKSIQSLQKQSESRWELILITNGSHDNTERIAQEIALQDKRIQIIRCNRLTPARARNTAYKAFDNSKFILFLQADECLLPGALQKMKQVLEENKDDVAVQIEATFLSLEEINEDNVTAVFDKRRLMYLWARRSRDAMRDVDILVPDNKVTPAMMAWGNSLFSPAQLLIRYDTARQVALSDGLLFDEASTPVADWDCYMRLLQKGDFAVLSETLVGGHRHKKTDVMFAQRDKDIEQSIRILRKKITQEYFINHSEETQREIQKSYEDYCEYLKPYYLEKSHFFLKKKNLLRAIRFYKYYLQVRFGRVRGGLV